MEVKEKYRTVEVSGKRIITTDWKETILVEDDFNEKDFDWDKFFDVEPKTYGEKTYKGEITDVVEGEEYSETSSHDFGTSPHKLITQDGEEYHTDCVRDDKGVWTKKIVGFSQLKDDPDAWFVEKGEIK